MAHIVECSVCRQDHIAGTHLECDSASLNDLLFRIQESLKKSSDFSLPIDLAKEIETGSFRSLEKFLSERQAKLDLGRKKELWKIAQRDFLRRATETFETSHPDPDPPRY